MTAKPRTLETINGLLALVEASGGKVETRIRIQKQAYLLRWLECPTFRDLDFSYHHYGPFSRQLSDGLSDAVRVGLLEEEATEWDEAGSKYTYKLHEKAERGGTELIPQCRPFVERMKGEHWRTLELGATAVFLQPLEEDADFAFDKALELKPACAPYVENARRLLADLRAAQAD